MPCGEYFEVRDDALRGVRLTTGETVPRDALVVAPRFRANGAFLASLGLAPTESHPLVCQQPLRESLRATGAELLELLPGSRSFKDVEALAR